jgi:hypothetical protein
MCRKELSLKKSTRFGLMIALLFASAPAIAGDVYRFTYERRGGLMETVMSGPVFNQGR